MNKQVAIEFKGEIAATFELSDRGYLISQALNRLMELESPKEGGFTPLQEELHTEIDTECNHEISDLLSLSIDDFHVEEYMTDEYYMYLKVEKF